MTLSWLGSFKIVCSRIKKIARIKEETTMLESPNEALNQQTKYSLELASQKDASSWLSALPLKKYNFCLTTLEFRDRLDLRYGRELTKTPSMST